MVERIKIGKRTVDGLKATGERYVTWDTEVPGFGVRVGPTGGKTYILKYRVGGGRSGRIRWGVLGQHGALTPDQARDMAQRWAAEVAAGGDPAGDKQEKRKNPTVAELMDEYLSNHAKAKNKASTARNAALLINKLIRPALGKASLCNKAGQNSRKSLGTLDQRPQDEQKRHDFFFKPHIIHVSQAFVLFAVKVQDRICLLPQSLQRHFAGTGRKTSTGISNALIYIRALSAVVIAKHSLHDRPHQCESSISSAEDEGVMCLL